MASRELFANIAQTTVTTGGTTAPASGTSETWVVSTSSGFPAASSSAVPPTFFRITDPAATSEQMMVTNVSGTTWTVTRGAEGTVPVAHASGLTVQNVMTAGTLGNFVQPATRAAVYLDDYGSDPSGVLSSDSAWTAAYAAAQALVRAWATDTGITSGVQVVLGAGIYMFTPGHVAVGDARIGLTGQGVSATSVVPGSGASGNLVSATSSGSEPAGTSGAPVGGFLLDGWDGGTGLIGLHLAGERNRMNVHDILATGFLYGPAYVFAPGNSGGFEGGTFDGLSASNCLTAFKFDGSSTSPGGTIDYTRWNLHAVACTTTLQFVNDVHGYGAEIHLGGNLGGGVLTGAATLCEIGTSTSDNARLQNANLNWVLEADSGPSSVTDLVITGTGNAGIIDCFGQMALVDAGIAVTAGSLSGSAIFSFQGLVEGVPLAVTMGGSKFQLARQLTAVDSTGTVSAYNVLAYGADPTGTADSTAAFQAAITAAGNKAAAIASALNLAGDGQDTSRFAVVVQVPPGIYSITPPSATVPALTVPSSVTIDGMNGAVLQKKANGILLDFSGTGPVGQGGIVNEGQGLRNITIDGGGFTGQLVRLYYVQSFLEEYVFLASNGDVSVDMAQCWDSRFNNGLYLYGGSSSASAISGGQACTHLIRNSAAPATTLSAGISGTVTSLPVAALPAAMPAGIVQVWNASGQLQNFTTTGASSAATSIPVTSAAVAHTFVSGDAVNGFGYSGDSSNNLSFLQSHWEDQVSGAVWITPGVDASGDSNFIWFDTIKCEQDFIGYNCPQIQVDNGDGIYFRGVQAYAGGFSAGYSTAVPFVKFDVNYGTLEGFALVQGGTQVLTTGITASAGTTVALNDTFYYWATAPTSGNATEVTAGVALIFNHYVGGTFTTAIATSGGAVYVLVGDQNGNAAFAGMVVESLTAGSAVINAGSSSLAPLKLTSGTVLTTAQAGATEYDGTALYFSAAASSRQVVDAEQFMALTTTYTLGSGTGLQKLFNATANGAVTVQASTSYFFECEFDLASMATASGNFSFGFGGTAGITSLKYTAVAEKSVSAGLTTVTTPQFVAGTAVAAQLLVSQTATNTTTGTARIRGIIRINGTGGTLIPQVALGVSTTTAVVGTNSFFRIWPLGSNAVTNVGDWS